VADPTKRHIAREDGRRLFGSDVEAYDEGRPGHPPRVYEILERRCGLGPGARVLEIGPGTGQATRRLVDLGAGVVAVEPDARLAGHLRSITGVSVVEETLEGATLPRGRFDLAVAASSFHWVDERRGLKQVAAALRPGGWVALWWTLFGDDERPSPFQDALHRALDDLYRMRGVEQEESPSAGAGSGRPMHALDVEARTAALEAAGFERLEHDEIPWTHAWTTSGIRALYASFSPIIRLDDETRAAALETVASTAERDFGGHVELPLLTSIYTARRPS
jgi:SAM-dependent methyltransferase